MIFAKRVRPEVAVPFILLALLLMAFGPLIPFLGFFWDDWPVILTGRLQGAAGFIEFYKYDRPISAWTYILTFPILGSKPIAWHIFSLLLRWATTAAMWWTLARLWPQHKSEAAWAAVLFAIYPVFLQQSTSVAYSQHWICYLLFFVSLGAMIQAHRVPRYRLVLTALGVSAALLHMVTMEYFVGLELLRPFLLLKLARETPAAKRQRISYVIRGWLPYLGALMIFIVWRFFLLDFPGEAANPPILLSMILSSPVDGILRLLQIAIQDTLHLLVSVWANIINPEKLVLKDVSIMFSWGMGAAAAAGLIYILLRLHRNETNLDAAHLWRRQAALFGAAAIVFGMLPVWTTDRQIIVGSYSDRFGLAAMFGASLLITAVISELVGKPAQRIVLISLLAGLAVSLHLQVANDYRWSWVQQTRFYWQLSWRAPALQPGTAIFSDGEIFNYVGPYSHSMGINLIYPPQQTGSQLPYYFFSLGREFSHDMPLFLKGMPIEKRFRHYTFQGNSQDGIVIYYNPADHDCLNVLGKQDGNIPGLPEITRQALTIANHSRILPGPQAPGFPPTEIFGPEPEHTWCYYFQKADLEAQQGNWDKVYTIAEQARAAGFRPERSTSNTPAEWIPLIEGYARTGHWDKAKTLSLDIHEIDARIDARLCRLWDTLRSSTPESEARSEAMTTVRDRARCP